MSAYSSAFASASALAQSRPAPGVALMVPMREAIGLVTTAEGQCACGALTSVFVNRNGVTACLQCDRTRRTGEGDGESA